jgi:hypothetical protein
MDKLVNREDEKCLRFRDALEELPMNGEARLSLEEWRAELPEADNEHAGKCAGCLTALEEFVETRNAMSGMSVPQPGPWFTARVMAAIAAKEQDEEEQDGVWISVRKLAPRLVAVSALLLVVGGTWALEVRRSEVSSADRRGGDIVFDSSVTPTWYDDGLGAGNEVRP